MRVNQWFNKISVRNKLLLFLLLPILTLLFFIFNSLQKELKTLDAQHHLSKHTDITFSLSHVISELQKERGLTAGYTSETIKNPHKLSQLQAQWKQTDKVIKFYKQKLTTHSQYRDIDSKQLIQIKKFDTFLSERTQIHNSIQTKSKSLPYFQVYSESISQGITVIRFINGITTDIQLSHMASAYVSLVQLQEQSAQERGLLNGVFNKHKISTNEFLKLSTLVSNQEVYLKVFFNEASQNFSQILFKKLQHPDITRVNAISQDILNRISRQELLNEIQQIIGYGGLIHLFKNYVIRGDKKYADQFEQSLRKMETLIQEFSLKQGTTQLEKDLFKRIFSTFDMYNHLLTIVSHRKRIGTDIIEIDRTVKVNDSMALDAIKQLRSRITYYDVSKWWKIASYKVDQFYVTNRLLEKEIDHQILTIITNASISINYYIILAITTIFTTILFAYLLFKRLVNDITDIAHTMEDMQMNNTNNQLLPEDGDDEISKMSRAFNQMILERVKFENQLQSALENAQAGILAKNQFLSTMSHEIRTPLNGVLGMSELLSQTRLNKEQHEYIETIMNSGKLLLTIINDILDFSKLEAKGVELEQISFNLEKTGFDTLQLLSAAAAEKNIELIFNYPLNIPLYFISDPSRLRQILLNLVNNAIKFTPAGHVLLEFNGLELDKNLYRITISVKDTGIGISEEYRAKLFDSFTQAEQSTTRQFGGTGLGLTISQRIVELMGGILEVSSELNKGSHFYFSLTLPVSNIEPESMDADLSDIRALIVDDNPVNLRIIEAMLQHYNIDTVLLDNPQETLSKLQESKKSGHLFDVVLLDHHMPHINGFELATAIKNSPNFSEIKLFLLTSGGMKGDAQKANEAGFSAYHTKPLRSDVLIQSLINVLVRQQENLTDSIINTNFNIEEAIDKKQLSETHTFAGQVLLTEDNLVNQKVALAVLKKLNLSVDVANDGLEAIEKYKTNHYDLIFMDCLMPNMDGFEATQSIREIENSNIHTPIIALTANALVEDQEKCRAAGMDDFISKPFKMIDISNVLERWLK